MGGKRGNEEAVRQNYDNSQLLRMYGAQFLAHTHTEPYLSAVSQTC